MQNDNWKIKHAGNHSTVDIGQMANECSDMADNDHTNGYDQYQQGFSSNMTHGEIEELHKFLYSDDSYYEMMQNLICSYKEGNINENDLDKDLNSNMAAYLSEDTDYHSKNSKTVSLESRNNGWSSSD
eukprot:Mrub_11969.p1 GENE.Mrub_11969~~Mrub_11969.p1  ORF type:complete len:140 (+),score=25.43 Mrub_11969:38-421(+)